MNNFKMRQFCQRTNATNLTSSQVNWPNFYRIRNLITVFSLRSHHEVGLISKVQIVTQTNFTHARKVS